MLIAKFFYGGLTPTISKVIYHEGFSGSFIRVLC